MEERMKVNYERQQVTAQLTKDEVRVIVIADGDARCYAIPSYGEVSLKVQDGHVGIVKVTANYKWGDGK
jgi:hypothetical protein